MIKISKINILNLNGSWKIWSHLITITDLIGELEIVQNPKTFYLFPGLDEKIPGFQCASDPTVCVCLSGHLNIEHRERGREGENTHISCVILFAPYSSSPAHVCMSPCGLVAGGRIERIVTSSTLIKELFIFSGLKYSDLSH